MKAINTQKGNINAIKMALFVAINVKALKKSPVWYRMNEILNWLNQFDSDDEIAISNSINCNLRQLDNEESEGDE